MKMFIIMLFISLGVVTTSQAQDLTNVQKSGVTLDVANPFNIDIEANFNEVLLGNYAKTNVVLFSHVGKEILNSISVTTTDKQYVEVLANTYDLKSHSINDNGKHTFIYGNKVNEARIFTNLVSANSGKFNIHRVVYNS